MHFYVNSNISRFKYRRSILSKKQQAETGYGTLQDVVVEFWSFSNTVLMFYIIL